ncbi:cytochrome c class I [Emticicia oligotrophica DSM 17448]|uniref:Cytochrome c class I n=1 Tax=Emticicia oligotrophica (strain DSM 17448 / CIP 109782 / MTCC 6937 / GPTSA100-15) TaxID=929562 RepID=A0ABM5N4E8_EMTOG|nr:c-type cytochrome [Emticicia oligotrophica]AFK04271.1 cytochrome c class I [Emticicia oligotrophica DSM 17448]
MSKIEPEKVTARLTKILYLLSILMPLALIFILSIVYIQLFGFPATKTKEAEASQKEFVKIDSNFVQLWTAPSEWRMSKLDPEEQKLIKYGKELIAHTADYLGPKGSVKPISNGMNCQNCHLNAGTQPWGNNYFAVQANYPKFRERSGTVENQIKRVNDCFERSLNGKALDSTSREMRAILAYIKWIGSDVPKKITPKGAGIFKLKGLKRATDPEKGRIVYEQKCQSCHQANGEGILAENGKNYTYPPLWGQHSYNNGAGLYRISNFAGYVKYNMPLGTTYERPQLSDEEAWDVAAFVNTMPRPTKDLSKDWPSIAGKPFDHPFGPYTDPFSEQQHKYGPYKPIKEWKEAHKSKK